MTHLFDLHAAAGHRSVSVGSARRDGACPFCGSDRAFQILRTAKSSKCPELGWYHCWACDKKGDAITWQMEVNGLSFRAAAEACGVALEDLQQPGSKPRRKRDVPGLPPLPSPSTASTAKHPQPDAWPEYVTRPEAWIEHGEKLISSCHEALLARPSALTWLAQRGVTLELIKQHRLGFHLGERVRGEDYQPSYRMASAWGMDYLGGQTKIIIQAGIVIPCFTRRGELRRVNIRTMRGEPKYRVIKGSQPFTVAQTVLNPGHDVAIILETELDGIALSGLLPDITIIPMGSATGRPGAEVNKELRHKSLILLALDRDEAGIKGVDWWLEHYRQAQPWCCPAGSFWIHPALRRDGDDHGKPFKDTGDTIRAGCDQRAWAAEGIALYAAHAPAPAKDDFLPQKKGAQLTGAGDAGKIDAAELLPPAPEAVRRMAELMLLRGGVVLRRMEWGWSPDYRSTPMKKFGGWTDEQYDEAQALFGSAEVLAYLNALPEHISSVTAGDITSENCPDCGGTGSFWCDSDGEMRTLAEMQAAYQIQRPQK
jgi:hypothetical protein